MPHDFDYFQIIHAFPKLWKVTISSSKIMNNLAIQDHHLITKHQLFCQNEHCSRDIYLFQFLLIIRNQLQKFFTRSFSMKVILNGKYLHCTSYFLGTVDTRLQIFQYKLINNVLYVNKMLFKFGKISSPLCSFSKTNDETLFHLFFECIRTDHLFHELE